MKWWDESWNPVVGCSPASPACNNCYAARDANRISTSDTPVHKYDGLVESHAACPFPSGWDGDYRKRPVFNGRIKVVAADATWNRPKSWKRPRTVFVCNMGDLFHANVPDSAIDRVFAVMVDCPQHLFLLCTKRPKRAAEFMSGRFVGPNIWMGATVEYEKWAAKRLPALVSMRGRFGGLFVSHEPALGPVDWRRHLLLSTVEKQGEEPRFSVGVDWIVSGGESGLHARPSHPDWIRRTRDFCGEFGVRFTFKQWGTWGPTGKVGKAGEEWGERELPLNADGTDCRWIETLVDETTAVMRNVGKHQSGHELDGELYEWLPRVQEVMPQGDSFE